jgi:hypothetical protein
MFSSAWNKLNRTKITYSPIYYLKFDHLDIEKTMCWIV